MKGKKNLEKAIVMGLLLSTSVYGTAWGADIGDAAGSISDNEKTLTVTNEKVYYDTTNEPKYKGKKLSAFETVIINRETDEDRGFGFELLTAPNANLSETDFDITMMGNGKNADALHLTNWGNNLTVKNFKANVSTHNSDAINIGHESTGSTVNILGNLTAVVNDGNGIRANGALASTNAKESTSTINVKGITNITINSNPIDVKQTLTYDVKENVSLEKILPGVTAEVTAKITADVSASYNPAAVYAGNDMYNFTYDIMGLVQEDFGSKTIGNGIINLVGDVNIKTTGENNYGIYSGKNGEINVNNINIISTGNNSIGIAAKNDNLIYGGIVSAIITDAKASATTNNPILDEIANQVLQNMIESMKKDPLTVDNADESENKYGSKVNLNGENVVINMQGDNSKAIYASGIDDSTEQNQNSVSGKNLNFLWVKGDIVAEDGGIIDLHITGNAEDVVNEIDGNILAQGQGANSETAAYSAKANSSKNATVNLTVDGELSGQGTLAAANGGTVNVVLGDRSNWAGRADDYQDAGSANWDHTKIENAFGEDTEINNSGTVNMTLGNEAVWNVTGQSWITNLTGDNSIILLDGDNTKGHALHVNKIEGSNTFVMNVRADETGDMLYVKNGTADKQTLIINNKDEVLGTMKVGDAIRFATVANSGNGFDEGIIDDETGLPKTSATNSIQTFGNSTRISDQGFFNVDFAIKYNNYNEKMDGDLAETEENNTVDKINDVYNGGAFSEAKPGSDYVDEVYGGINNDSETTINTKETNNTKSTPSNIYIVRQDNSLNNISDAGKTIINMSRANYKNAIYMDRLNKRLGEARYINSEDEQGMWVRLRHDRIGQSCDFRSMNTMYELGYDVKQDCDNGERRIGMAVDYMRGSTSYSDIAGKGETKRYGLWLYDTWLGDKGHYADYVLKWGHLQNDFDIKSKTRFEDISGDYSNNVFSVSAEYGKKNDMGNNWYFEPQAQLQFARVTGADYVTSQDTKVSLDGINSLIGRAGFRLGRDLNENSTVYVKADLLHEFLGDQTITASDLTGIFRETFENKGTWYDVGFGFATAVGKNSYAFMDFEKSFGNDNDETYQINAGVQWTF